MYVIPLGLCLETKNWAGNTNKKNKHARNVLYRQSFLRNVLLEFEGGVEQKISARAPAAFVYAAIVV